MQTFEPKLQPAATPAVETPTPAAAPDLHPVLRLQRLVGNRAVQRMFVQRAVDPTKDDDVLAFMKKLNGEGADAILRDLESEGRAVQLAVRRNLVRARGDIHEERLFLCVAAIELKGTTTADRFERMFPEMFAALKATGNYKDEAPILFDYVDPKGKGKITNPAKFPGDTIVSRDGNTYVVLETKVRRKGDSAWRCNNPGNLTVNSDFPEAWSYGAYDKKNLWGRFPIFPTIDDGWEGLRRWMDARKTKTVMAYAESHAPASEAGNDPVRYARILVRHTFGTSGQAAQEKVAKETTVEALLAAGWPSKLKPAFNEAEGFTTGDEVDFEDTSLPADVGPAVRAGRDTTDLKQTATDIDKANKAPATP
ncbi:MAG TPA: hypothetical protein VFE33_11125 [Thermoanaerobaculia bacterium]|nr:hypothetical protein [Thermoanaerobaculia bacterium]